MYRSVSVLLLSCFIYNAWITTGLAEKKSTTLPVHTLSFSSVIEDFPLMPGLKEIPDHSLIFDKPGGRILETVVLIESPTRKEIESYYDTALPSFGWKKIKPNLYKREKENLTMHFEETEEKKHFLILTLEPNTH